MLFYFGSTGQQESMEIGLYYYNGRYYAPTLGCFLSSDTLIPDQKQRYTILEKADKLKC